jgi:hypothetical protein
MKSARLQTLCCLILLLGGAACAGEVDRDPVGVESESPEGRLGFGLIVGDGIVLGDVRYSVVNPSIDYSYMATVPYSVLKSDALGLFLLLPADAGYELTVEADLVTGGTCVGKSEFEITKDEHTDVHVQLHCPVIDNTGTADIEGSVNGCPTIGSAAALPATAAIEDVIVLQASATDYDQAPAELTYNWNSDLGDLGDSNQAQATLVCTQPGSATVKLTVSDGDPLCNAEVSFKVTCVQPPPVKPPAP